MLVLRRRKSALVCVPRWLIDEMSGGRGRSDTPPVLPAARTLAFDVNDEDKGVILDIDEYEGGLSGASEGEEDSAGMLPSLASRLMFMGGSPKAAESRGEGPGEELSDSGDERYFSRLEERRVPSRAALSRLRERVKSAYKSFSVEEDLSSDGSHDPDEIVEVGMKQRSASCEYDRSARAEVADEPVGLRGGLSRPKLDSPGAAEDQYERLLDRAREARLTFEDHAVPHAPDPAPFPSSFLANERERERDSYEEPDEADGASAIDDPSSPLHSGVVVWSLAP